MSHSSSLTWRSPSSIQQDNSIRTLQARHRICPRSPFFTLNADQQELRLEHRLSRLQHLFSASRTTMQDYTVRKTAERQQNRSLGCFAGHILSNDNRSLVLSRQTVFSATFDLGREYTAPWPSLAEFKYEGDERVATDAVHRRCLPHPRRQTNETVNWQVTPFIEQYPFDGLDRRTVVEVSSEADDEVDDEQAEELLGEELLYMISA